MEQDVWVVFDDEVKGKNSFLPLDKVLEGRGRSEIDERLQRIGRAMKPEHEQKEVEKIIGKIANIVNNDTDNFETEKDQFFILRGFFSNKRDINQTNAIGFIPSGI